MSAGMDRAIERALTNEWGIQLVRPPTPLAAGYTSTVWRVPSDVGDLVCKVREGRVGGAEAEVRTALHLARAGLRVDVPVVTTDGALTVEVPAEGGRARRTLTVAHFLPGEVRRGTGLEPRRLGALLGEVHSALFGAAIPGIGPMLDEMYSRGHFERAREPFRSVGLDALSEVEQRLTAHGVSLQPVRGDSPEVVIDPNDGAWSLIDWGEVRLGVPDVDAALWIRTLAEDPAECLRRAPVFLSAYAAVTGTVIRAADLAPFIRLRSAAIGAWREQRLADGNVEGDSTPDANQQAVVRERAWIQLTGPGVSGAGSGDLPGL